MLKPDLKQKLSNGEVVFGTFFKLNSASLVEMLGYAGFDFVIIDNEHSNYSFSEMENLIRAGDCVNMHTIVRIPSATEENIAHALDSGASGVQVPGLTTVEQVKKAMVHTKYYPLGRRGLTTVQRACKFSFMNKNDYIKASNEDTLVVVHVENKEMVDQIEELCQISQIDVLFAGPADLSQSIGKPGEVNDPEVMALIEKIFTVAAKYKKAVGIYVGNAASAEKYIKMGAQFIAFQSDVAIIYDAIKNYNKIFNELKNK
ncbi:2-keto-3-deoxy-L-rhamnonate aldolase [Clostridium malenominatum]|uniref:2-keto-3-deoxy-L-rhamnonate aldolase n=1 Tax=Clostridium malenominatum TaxID=1539 RepID=A0ABN1IS32_9CLOT